MQGSGKNPYIITHKEGPNGPYAHCTCPAWKFIKDAIENRKCKHIMMLLQDSTSCGTCATPNAPSKRDNATTDAQTHASNKRKIDASSMNVALAEKWTSEDPAGYYLSEKLDGMRCLWDGSKLYTRNGNPIHAPPNLVAQLPDIALDGELFLGRGKFQELMSIVKRHNPNDQDWTHVTYAVFDAPNVNAPFAARLQEIDATLLSCKWASKHPHTRCVDRKHVFEELDRILTMGGEGVMLRHPTAPYKDGRTTDLLKVKKFMDAEAYVIGYETGKGRNYDRMGALQCRDEDGIHFKVGTGFPDAMRDNPPPVGTRITYKYQEKTRDGKPRFPVFLRVRMID
jgi:DNA ligase-1